MKKKGLLIVISGPSGAGKGTICKELVKKKNFYISVSATTRKPRNGETEGVSYYFLSKNEFMDRVKNNEFLEYADVYGNMYGTPRRNVEEKLRQGIDVILEIDIQGALKVKKTFPDGVFIFILPPSMEELKKRIINRKSETAESLMTRFKSAYNEINYVSEYNYAVVNDDVETAAGKVISILTAEKCKVSRIEDLSPKEEFFDEKIYDQSAN